MSRSLSNLCNVPIPFPYERTTAAAAASSRFPQASKVSYKFNGVKAMAADGRENLDHLRRASKDQPRKKTASQVAPIGLWDGFPRARTVQQMMETMERMMEDPLSYNNGGWRSESEGGYSRGRSPWEIKEGEGEYKLRFDMPGMNKDDVKVWVEEKMLVVKAEKMKEEGTWPAKSYGRYNRRVVLPDNVHFEKINAEVKDGVLYITIPKPAHDDPNILNINVE